MHYSDVAEKYYNDTKKRILENVLAAEEKRGGRPAEKGNEERRSGEIKVMTNREVRNEKAKIRSKHGTLIAAACALVVLGSAAAAMNMMKVPKNTELSSKAEIVERTAVTSAEKKEEVSDAANDTDSTQADTASSAAEEDTDISYNTEDTSKADNDKRKADTSKAEETNNSTNSLDNTSSNTDTRTDTVTQPVQDKTQDSRADTNSTADSKTDITSDLIDDKDTSDPQIADYDKYEKKNDVIINSELLSELDNAGVICEGTVTSQVICGRTADEVVKPLDDFTEDEVGDIRRLYYRCTVTIDAGVYKGEDKMNVVDSFEEHDANTGELVFFAPVGKKLDYSNDPYDSCYAAAREEIADDYLFCRRNKVLLVYFMDENGGNYAVTAQDIYIWQDEFHEYRKYSDFIPTMTNDDAYRDQMTDYILSTFEGKDPSAAEDWAVYHGKGYSEKSAGSEKYDTGRILQVTWDDDNGLYSIITAFNRK